MPNWRIVAAVAAMAAYAALSHLLMTRWPDQPWSVALLFGPLLCGIALTGLLRRSVATVLACVALAAVLVAVAQAGGVSVNRLYVLQHAAIHAVLAWTFGITLRPGAKALITLLAERVHTVFLPAQAVYTRRLTAVWTGYFLAVIALSFAIYAWAPWSVWSVYCNAVTPATAIALFVGEHLFRYRRHPEFERVTMASALRAYRTATAPQ